jgi:hypothetical protein
MQGLGEARRETTISDTESCKLVTLVGKSGWYTILPLMEYNFSLPLWCIFWGLNDTEQELIYESGSNEAISFDSESEPVENTTAADDNKNVSWS